MKRFSSLFLVFAFSLNTFGSCAFAQVTGNSLGNNTGSNEPTTSNGQTMTNQALPTNNNTRNPIFGTWVINANDLDIVAIVIRKNSSVIFTGDDSKHQITSIEGSKIVSDLGEFTLEIINRTGIVGYQNDDVVFNGLKKGTRPPAPSSPTTSFTDSPTPGTTNTNPSVNANNGPSANGLNSPFNGPKPNGASFNGPSLNGAPSLNQPTSPSGNSNTIETPSGDNLESPKPPQNNLLPPPDQGGMGSGSSIGSIPNTQSEQPATAPLMNGQMGAPGNSFTAMPGGGPGSNTFFNQPTNPSALPAAPYVPATLPTYPGQTNNGSTGFENTSSTTSGIPSAPRPGLQPPTSSISTTGGSNTPGTIIPPPAPQPSPQMVGTYNGPPPSIELPPPPPDNTTFPANPQNPIGRPPLGGVAAAGIGTGAAIGAGSVNTQPQPPPISPGGIGRINDSILNAAQGIINGAVIPLLPPPQSPPLKSNIGRTVLPAGNGETIKTRGVNIPAGTINPITGETSSIPNSKNNGSKKVKTNK